MHGPSPRFRQLAARKLVDTISLQTQTSTPATRATMASGDLTLGPATEHRALVRQATLLDQNDVDVDRAVRDLTVWVGDDAMPVAGERCNFVTVRGDSTLDGDHGTVLFVERDTIRKLRIMTVRMPNDE